MEEKTIREQLSRNPPVTAQQAQVLLQLATAYQALCDAWDDSWEGPEGLGGTLADGGLLPVISLDEASDEVHTLYEDSMLLLTGLDIIRDTFHGSTEYAKTDAQYHYYLTIHEGKGDHMHRISTETYEYEFCYDDEMNRWIADEVVTRAIQKEHGKLFHFPTADEA